MNIRSAGAAAVKALKSKVESVGKATSNKLVNFADKFKHDQTSIDAVNKSREAFKRRGDVVTASNPMFPDVKVKSRLRK